MWQKTWNLNGKIKKGRQKNKKIKKQDLHTQRKKNIRKRKKCRKEKEEIKQGQEMGKNRWGEGGRKLA